MRAFFCFVPCPPQVICDARYIVIAACCNTPGSTNDRLAYREAKFDTLVESLPGEYFVLGDAAYGATDKMIVPYPGCDLDGPSDSFNFFQSQGRMCIEQTFGIMVSFKCDQSCVFFLYRTLLGGTATAASSARLYCFLVIVLVGLTKNIERSRRKK